MTAVEVCKLTYDMPVELPPGSLPGTAQGTEVVMMQVPPLYALKRDFGPVPVLQGPVIR